MNSRRRDNDDLLATRISQTLERQAQHPDPELDARLRAVLQAPRHPYSGWLEWTRQARWALPGLALAAGLATFVILPSPVHEAANDVTAVHPTEDPQFIEDIDMLSAIGEDSPNSN